MAQAVDAGPGAIEAPALVRKLVAPRPLPPADVVDALESEVARMLGERLPVWRTLGIVAAG